MDLGPVRGLALDIAFDVHGVPAIVTPPSAMPIETRLIWPAQAADALPSGLGLQRQEDRKVAALRRDEVPTVRKGTLITAPPRVGEPDAGWIVDGTERIDPDHVRVYVVPDPNWPVT